MTTSGRAAEQHCRHILHATTTRVNPRPGPHQSGREALAGLPRSEDGLATVQLADGRGREALAGLPRSEGLKALPPRGWQSPPGAAPPADGPPSAPAPRRQEPDAGCGRGLIFHLQPRSVAAVSYGCRSRTTSSVSCRMPPAWTADRSLKPSYPNSARYRSTASTAASATQDPNRYRPVRAEERYRRFEPAHHGSDRRTDPALTELVNCAPGGTTSAHARP